MVTALRRPGVDSLGRWAQESEAGHWGIQAWGSSAVSGARSAVLRLGTDRSRPSVTSSKTCSARLKAELGLHERIFRAGPAADRELDAAINHRRMMKLGRHHGRGGYINCLEKGCETGLWQSDARREAGIGERSEAHPGGSKSSVGLVMGLGMDRPNPK